MLERDTEGYYDRGVNQRRCNKVNIYAPDIGAPKHIKQN